jgi:probable F420-dependent oxidoreductase
LKYSVHIPVGNVTPGEFQSLAAVREMVSALETANIDCCCVTDHPAPSAQWLQANGHDALDPFSALSFIAALSPHLELQTNILVLPYRNPFITAKAAATVHTLSGGRLILGVGAGYQQGEFAALGVDFHRRGALCDEALELLPQIWQGGVIAKQGLNFSAAENEPRPALNPLPRVWIGGSSEKAIERVVNHGDGWCPYFSVPRLSQSNQASGIHSIAELRERIARIRERRVAIGKSASFDVAIGPPPPLSLENNHSRKNADDIVAALQEMEEAGVTYTVVNLPHPSRSAFIENVAWFHREIMQHMR